MTLLSVLPAHADSIREVPLPNGTQFGASDAKSFGSNLIVVGCHICDVLSEAAAFSVNLSTGAATRIPLDLPAGTVPDAHSGGASSIGLLANDLVISGGVSKDPVNTGDAQALLWSSGGSILQSPSFPNDPAWIGLSRGGVAVDRFFVVGKESKSQWALGNLFFSRDMLVASDGAQFEFAGIRNRQFPLLDPFTTQVYGAARSNDKARFLGAVAGELTRLQFSPNLYYTVVEGAIWEFNLNTRQFTRFEHARHVQGFSNVIWQAISPSGRTLLGWEAINEEGILPTAGHLVLCDFERTACRPIPISPYKSLWRPLGSPPLVFDGPGGPLVFAPLEGSLTREQWVAWSEATGVVDMPTFVKSRTGVTIPANIARVAGSSVNGSGQAVLFISTGVKFFGDRNYVLTLDGPFHSSTATGLVTVPALSGRSQAAASTAIQGAGLTLGAIASAPSNAIPAGAVIRHSPAAASQVAAGAPVGLVISSGPGTVTVPNLAGLTQSAAVASLQAVHLTAAASTAAPDLVQPAGAVISQSPSAGSQVSPDSSVSMVISSGHPQTTVPNLVGLSEAAAGQNVAAARLFLAGPAIPNAGGCFRTPMPHASIPAGNIISQSPAAGSVVDAGSAVCITVSTGPPTITVPDVRGQTRAAAEAAIVAAGLTVGEVILGSSWVEAAGLVVSQGLNPGSKTSAGWPLTLVISTGPAFTIVPNLAGLTQAAAATTLEAAFLKIGAVTQSPSPTAPPGTAIGQTPRAGIELGRGTLVDVVLSSGPGKVVPNVVNMPQGAASVAIAAAGLTVGTITPGSSPTIVAGNVISQTPAAGVTANTGSPIALVVSAGPARTVPDLTGMLRTAALAALQSAGLAPGSLIDLASTTSTADTVIRQSPLGGQQAVAGSTVDIVLSLGPVAPSVVGQTQAAAGATIQAAGLAVGSVTTSPAGVAGIVVSQAPAPGMAAAPGSPVNLVVGAGVAPVVVPDVLDIVQAEAVSRLAAAGLTAIVTKVPHPTKGAGSTLTQNPLPGGVAAAGSAVALSVVSEPRLQITKSHTGSFSPGQQGATYTVVVSNAADASPVRSPIRVTETLPAGLTLVSMSGQGWSCQTAVCSRLSEGLATGASFPPITVVVNVAPNATSPQLNSVIVTGQGSAPATATDPTTIIGAGGPRVVSLTPSTGTGASRRFTFKFQHPSGAQALEVMNVLINDYLDGRQACYLAYSRPANALYIVADNGDSTQISGKTMNGVGSVSNSQCSVDLTQSSASASGTEVTLDLNIGFATSFGGNKVVYAAARDAAAGNSGWQTIGTHSIPPLAITFPRPGSVSPSSGNAQSALLSFTFQDASSANNLQTGWALINTAIDGRSACYVAYYRPGNQIFLYPDNGDGNSATSTVLTGSNSLSNSQCAVSAVGSSVTASGPTLTVTLNVTFKAAFAGPKAIWLATQTLTGAVSPWQALGAWVVP
ncbi:MAG: PASTA domain-containing protein [Bryobacteraceae bacterium]